MLIKKVRATKHTYSFKQNITWKLIIIAQFMIVIKQAPKDLKEEKSLENQTKYCTEYNQQLLC